MFKKKTPEAPRARTRAVQQTSQNTVFSYHANRAGANDPRGRQMPDEEKTKRLPKKPAWLRARNMLNALVVLIIFLLLVGLSSTPKIVVLGDETSQAFLRDTAVYQQAAHRSFGSSVLNGNKLTVNTTIVTADLKKQFPELHTVSVSLPVFGRQPTVYVQPATPHIILLSHGERYMLDSNGRALSVVRPGATLPTGKKALPLVEDKSDLAVSVGTIALPSDSIAFIDEVAGQLRAKGMTVETWTLPIAASELDVKPSGVGYTVKFNLRGKAREQAGSFIAVKQRLDAQKTSPAEYIDVRVVGRAFYK